MTTNKPEVVKYIVPKHEAWDVRTLVSPRLPGEQLMVLASDYEALQADRDQQYQMKVKARKQRDRVAAELKTLQAAFEELRTALSESRANDRQAMYYLNQIRWMVGGDDFPDMVRRCEKLRKVADQYRRLIELGEDFQWENIIRVDISDFPSRADAIDAVMQGDQP